MKRATIILVILLILATVPAAVAEDHTVVWEFDRVLECPAGNRLFAYFTNTHFITNRTFDTATVECFNMTIKATQPADITLYIADFGHKLNVSYRQVTSRVLGSEGTVTFDASDFELDEWTGFPQNYSWSNYYNTTHYSQVIKYRVTLPFFLIEFFNTGTDETVVIWDIEYNLTLHGYRYSEDVTYIPKSSDWPILPPDDENGTTTIHHWWGDWWPGTSNPFVDVFFQLWLDDQEFDSNEWYCFYYDPTQFYPVAFEKGFLLGILIGVLGACVIGLFASRGLSV